MKKRRYLFALSALVLLGLPLASCGGDESPVTPAPTDKKVASFTVISAVE